MSTVLSGSFDLAGAIEGSSLTAVDATNTNIATFTDSNNTDTPASFTATIDWGDGVTTTPTIIGGSGSFTVPADHIYADDDFVSPVLTINRTADSSQLVLSGGVNVSDADHLAGQPTPVLTGSSGVALNNVTVGIFSDTYHGHPDGSDFTTNIDWGDGTVTAGTVSGSGAALTVTGSHTYATDGQFTITTFLNDDTPDASFAQATTQADIGFGANVVLNAAAEFDAISTSTTVATFSDNTGDPVTDYSATIDWGDGTTTNGVISGTGPSFTVTSQTAHTYADEGDYNAVVTINRAADGSVPSGSITASGTVTVQENGALEVTSTTTITGSPGVSTGNVTLATFSDSKISPAGTSPNVAGDFVANVDWGDGTTTIGTVTGSGGTFTVSGSHTYAQNGTETISVTLSDDPEADQAFANATAQTTAFIGIAPATTSDISATEGTAVPANTQLATFTDSNTSEGASAFSATIDWGDGSTSAGTVTGSSGTFTVTAGPHTYTDEAQALLTTTVTHASDNTTITMTGQATVGDADHLVLTADNFSGSQGSATNVQVATFTDTYLPAVASDFLASIDWGDGQTSLGTITGSNGSFTVDASHAYATAGTDTFTVTVQDDDLGTASASGSGTATIVARTIMGTMVLASATEATALSNTTTVATFTDSQTSDMAGDFSATIDWGDGVTTAGTVVGSNWSFTVQGGHTYADEGSDPASVTFTYTPDNVSATASGSVTVAEADVLTGHGTTFRPKAGQSFTGTVATFSDTDTANVAGDFTATINWGDGTVTGGTVSGGSGTFTVSGTHTYAHAGHENVTVTLNDDAPGTATATALSSANVSTLARNDFNGDNKSDFLLQNNGANNPNVMVELLNGTTITSSATFTAARGTVVEASGDFNNDGNADIVLQTSDGTPQIWLMNGTTRTSTVTLTNLGSAWHVISADDFNNDGNTDLLFQNTNGSVAIWTMNGTSVVSNTTAGNPGQSWHAIKSGDFNNDGNADILFQNDDGTPKIWEMNGSSIVAQATLTNPGKFWHAIGTGDFNGDGNADILFQNKDGTPLIWEMNGTSILTQATLTNPGVQLQAIGTGDFNGDGMSDILYQNSDGTPVVWTMNGTSVVSTATYANPGSSWVLKDDGPIQGGQNGNGQGPTPHLSLPDVASPVAQNAAQSAPPLSSPDPAGAWMWTDANGGMSLLPGPTPGGLFVPTR